MLLSEIDHTINLSWYYNERHHGKGPMDGIGGTVKNLVFRDVKSSKCIINSAKEFAEYAEESIEGISSLYLPRDNVIQEPQGIDVAPKIPETLKIHKVRHCYDKNKVCYLEFYHLASDEKPFFTQFYRSESDPEVCGHVTLDSIDENLCALCNLVYDSHDGDWLKCPICKAWFHHGCFYE